MCVQVPVEARKGVTYPGTAIMADYEPSNSDAGI